MCGVWTLYGNTTMVVSLIVVLAEASRNVIAESPSSSESRWTLIWREQGGLVGVWVASQFVAWAAPDSSIGGTNGYKTWARPSGTTVGVSTYLSDTCWPNGGMVLSIV